MPAVAKPPLEVALQMLARRARSEAEIRRALLRKGITEAEVETVITRLKELRFLDDRAFAARRAETLLVEGHWGPAAIERRLAAAGVDEPVAREAIEAARQGETERELALKALEKRRPRVSERSAAAERIRAARWLVSHGFCEEVARAVLGLSEEV